MVSPQLHRVGGTVFVKSEWPAELVVLPRARQTNWQLRAWGNCDVNEKKGRHVTSRNEKSAVGSRRWVVSERSAMILGAIPNLQPSVRDALYLDGS